MRHCARSGPIPKNRLSGKQDSCTPGLELSAVLKGSGFLSIPCESKDQIGVAEPNVRVCTL